ncbi:nucleoside triphosphate pyrophosphohydrolase family protein [Hydrogenophaga sp. PAMC20947]|uniref:nucleoside triphosphate pyrophosphohydrolase family protein n=1 Tax=Hydrogenophaga sp. PAMC20947 TaxID=2565558 RepID=UPI001B34C084|nr:nucleoside triphosphate pyrophosphohydrolase family protein [Hydrogenophaga sp. PAMC20947]
MKAQIIGAPLTLLSYCKQAAKTDRFTNEAAHDHYKKLTFGFFGEIGGLLSALKKRRRDQLYQTDSEVVRDEIGDALWYLVNAAGLSGIGPNELGQAGLFFLRRRFNETSRSEITAITFRQLDGIASLHHTTLSRSSEELLRELAYDSGLATSFKFDRILNEPVENRASMFGQLLGDLALVSACFALELGEIANQNLLKIYDRWPPQKRYYLIEPGGKDFEQFPARMEVEFIQRKIGNRLMVVQQIKGLNIGDPLTDNSRRADGYRFHDVFHLSYAAHLGWSPVIRALLKLKRKSEPQLDENEDGARAIILEEGIATWIFNHAKGNDRKLYADVPPGRLDYSLLKQIRSMVDGLMVANCPLWQWENAILDGFRVFRELYHHKGGIVIVDLKRHKLIFNPPVPSTEII